MNPTYNTVGNYMSPYNDAVVQATMRAMNNQNAEQQQGVIGNAIAKGAYGGNRVGVAQGELARQQDLANQQTIAGLYNQNYSQALGAAQNQQQVGLGAASAYGNLGATQMQTGLAQAQAQLGAGTQQQQFDYQQYLNAQGYPYQQQAWLASIAGGLAPSAGGTTTQQTPQGNIFSQVLGAGLGVASLFNEGGRVHAALGGAMPYANDNGMFPSYMTGSLGTPYANDNTSFPSYIPKLAIAGGGGNFPTISDPGKQPDIMSDYSDAMKAGASNIKNWWQSATQPKDLGLASGGRAHMAFGGDPGVAFPGNPSGAFSWPGINDPMPSGASMPTAASTPPVNSGLSYVAPGTSPGGLEGLFTNGFLSHGMLAKPLAGLFANDPWSGMRSQGQSPSPFSGMHLWGSQPANPGSYLHAAPDMTQDQTHNALLAQQTMGRGAATGQTSSSTGFNSKAPVIAAGDQARVRAALGLRNGGRAGYADGGSTDDLQSVLDAIYGPSGRAHLDNPIPPVPVTDAATPIDGSRLGLGAGNGTDLNAYAPIAGKDYSPASTPDDRGLNVGGLNLPPTFSPPAPTSAGVVPYSHGDQFLTSPTVDPKTGKPYSANIGDAWGSLTSGNGLNLSPDTKQALLAAGLGMMASKSPFALQGIGEGGLQGVATWNARQKLESDLANQRAANAQTGAQIALLAQQVGLTKAQAQRETVGALTDRYDFTQTMAGMLVKDKINPASSQIIPYNQLDGWATSHGGSASELPGGGQPPSSGGTAPMTMTADGPRFNVQPPKDAMPSGMGFTDAGQGIVAGQTTGALDDARKSATTANETAVQLAALKNAEANLPSSGILAPGSFATERGSMAKTFNTMAQMAGLPPPFDPNQVGSVEEMNKLTTQFGFNLARTTGADVAASVVSLGVGAVPGIENSPQGFKAITSLIQASLNRTKDYYDAMQKWASKTGGDLTGFTEDFNKQAPPSAYANAAVLSSAVVPRTQADIDNAPAGTLFNINGQLMVK